MDGIIISIFNFMYGVAFGHIVMAYCIHTGYSKPTKVIAVALIVAGFGYTLFN